MTSQTTARAADLLRERLDPIASPGGAHHVEAVSGQRASRGRTDPAAGSGDDGGAGQIGPVISVRTDLYVGPTAPHLRAPVVFERHPDAIGLSLPHTYRFGPATASAMAPLYDVGFTSARPPRCVIGVPGLDAIRVDDVDSNTDAELLGVVVHRATGLVGRITDADGELLPVGDVEIAVVASHNAQVALLRGLLAERGHPEITVGTADKLQGGQWEAVVAVDPRLVG